MSPGLSSVLSRYFLAVKQIATVDVRQSGSTPDATARTDVPQVVSAVRPHRVGRTMLDMRLTYGLLRFPLGESAETRQPRW